jgi:hypothetical protein
VTAPELRDLVGWTVEDTPPEVVVGRRLARLLHVVSAVATLGADAAGGARTPTWELPADPAAFVDLGVVELHGRSSLLPAPAPRTQLVAATRQDVWLVPGRSERPTARLPVDRLRVVGAVPGTGSRRPRHAYAPWTLTLDDGRDHDAHGDDGQGTLTLSGAWLALAWIGHLAGWPEPATDGATG